MAESGKQKVSASVTGNPYGHVDEELASVAARNERRKKRMKCFAYVAAFAVFQTAIILLFALTVMRVKSPKFRVRSASFDQKFEVSTLVTNASFDIRMNAELGVKNTNFGHYKYQNSTIEFFYKDIKVGEAFVPRARAKARSTRKFYVTLDLSSANVPGQELGNELSQHAWIPLTSTSTLRGKVEIMKVMKKKKSSNMNCSMNLNISSKQLQDLMCK